MEKTLEKNIVKGGGFLFNHPHFSEIFIPEEFNDEQKMMAKATQDFIDKEVFPFVERIDALEEGLMPSIMTKAGELGLLGVCIPEQYGGLGMSFNTGMKLKRKNIYLSFHLVNGRLVIVSRNLIRDLMQMLQKQKLFCLKTNSII
jgi:hypothetical protein